jgi:hypothetical protein
MMKEECRMKKKLKSSSADAAAAVFPSTFSLQPSAF